MSEKNKEKLSFLLSNEEWQVFECKRAAIKPARLLETVVAFANSNGGTIVLGLEDVKKAKNIERLLGISENRDNISSLMMLISKEIEPAFSKYISEEIPILNVNKKEDHLFLLKIDKSDDVHSLKNGDTYIRKGNQNQKIGASEIIRLKYEKGSLMLESELTGISNLDDLDKDLIGKFKNDINGKGSDWQFLKDSCYYISPKIKWLNF